MGEPAPADRWFSVRCVLRQGVTYEERVTLWRASGHDEAIALAEADAQDYGATVGFEYVGLAQSYELADEPGHGAEVFSLMRDSDLGTEAYLDAHFDTGRERQRVDGQSDGPWVAEA